MPLTSVHSILFLFLAALGSLLFLALRRQQAGWWAQAVPPGPALRSAMQAPASGRSSSGTPFPPSARGELILVVDDEASVRDLLSTVLLNHGYKVAVARDGVEGLRLFSADPHRIDLVLTDLHMPNSSGQSFADLIRPLRPDVRILFMSGLDAGEGGPESALARSNDPFLLKPFKPAALLGTIHQLLHPDDLLKT